MAGFGAMSRSSWTATARWATQRGLPRRAGHRAGTENVRRVLERFADHGVEHVTLYGFSTENWARPAAEVRAIMRLLGHFLRREVQNLHRNNVQLRHIGHLEDLPDRIQEQVRDAIALTRDNDGLILNIAFSYGGRDDIVVAVREMIREGVAPEEVTEQALARRLFTSGSPDPDMLIRTGGDTRISNFLLWQSAYAELYFTDTFWPDFGREDIDIALAEYGRRKRRFGALDDEDRRYGQRWCGTR
ncbi:MAG: polyprenyl diphosphate synthase [Dehalococcoidia bacterium]|nr:polyprenyl diphosphate synthase [Dehalococcoidia bacterium]